MRSTYRQCLRLHLMAKSKQSKKAKTSKRPNSDAASSGKGKRPARRKTANGRSLVIVESPAKAKTINKYLGKDYVVKASMGHVRDLPSRGLAVDIENNFSPTYRIVPGRKKVITELQKFADNAEAVYLATDLDREGEAIAWHLVESLGLDESKIRRVVFNEITQSAIRDSFADPHRIDMDKVNAQQARRILDRIVGYELSPLLWKKIAKGLSAGRVQSVTVRMVVEREKEIRAFVPSEYWTIVGYFALAPDEAERLGPEWESFLSEGGDPDTGRTQREITEWLSANRAIRASLVAIDSKPFKPTGSCSENAEGASIFNGAVKQARQVAEALGFVVEDQEEKTWQEYADKGLHTIDLIGSIDRRRLPEFTVADIQTKRTKSNPNAPFTTATLQQTASSQLKLSTSRTMRLAQQLYEGVELAGEDGPVGLITYMRTDSTNLSADSVKTARGWIKDNCGDLYLPERPNVYASKKRAQEAHEAIRPTEVTRTPESLKKQLSSDLYRLYTLIWRRFVACQMTPAQWDSTSVIIKADTAIGEAEFKATGRTLVFDGYYKIMGVPKSSSEQILPEMTLKQNLSPFDIEPEQQFTSPPPRYTEASLVKSLEAEGIGRPSTYAAIIQTIQDRGYVEQTDRRLFATDKGAIVTEKLMDHFPKVMDIKFTSFMEDELDKIEEAHLDWVKVLHEFYDPFHEALVVAHDQMEQARAEPSEYKCELCGGEMVYRWAKTGRFLSCTNYPECKGALNVNRDGKPIGRQKIDIPCDLCGGDMVLRQSRHGPFLGCSKYPKCTNTITCDESGEPLKLVSEKELEEPCPACGEGVLQVRRRGVRAFLGCSKYPECKNTKSLPKDVRLERKITPVQEAGVDCERCGKPMIIRSGRRGKFIACSGFPRCRNTKPIEQIEELKSKATAGEPAAVADKGKKRRSARKNADKAKAARKTASKAAKAGKGPDGLGPPPPGFAWTRTGKPVVENWPEGVLYCPECGGEMALRAGRFGPFYSCGNFPKCKFVANLRGKAKKRADIEMPPPEKAKPIPTDIDCEECGQQMVIREGPSGKFLGCSTFPTCKSTKPLPAELANAKA
ncbi:MAG: type I DNA topoisomerase [Planctomycetota bacterium]|nr:MAG: type I DNA topoisomerase [Planctomycetota bacterium]